MKEDIKEIIEFLEHIDGRVGQAAHDTICETVERLESKIKALKNMEPSQIITQDSDSERLFLDFCYYLNSNHIEDIKYYLGIENVREYLKSKNGA